MITVGFDRRDYNTARNISSVPFRNTRVQRCRNVFRYPNHLIFKVFGYTDPFLSLLHYETGRKRYDMLHLFNSISLGSKPWIVTYESVVPYWSPPGFRRGNGEFGLRRMAGSACKRIIAMSAAADRIERKYLEGHPVYADFIIPKMVVMHPPQVAILETAEKIFPDGMIQFAIVGNHFFRKGGIEVLRAFDALLAKNLPIKLSIISTLELDDQVAVHLDKAHLDEARRIRSRHPDRIVHFAGISNSEVIQLLKRTHVGLLPTWAETYGYSVLEAQACGCPVISTDIRALPEINDEHCGWLIKVPQYDLGFAAIGDAKARKIFSEVVQSGLEQTITEIARGPSLIQRKGSAALANIRAKHDPVRFAERLEAIYLEGLTRRS
jgi:glycosyltransferase involved in cell wall biosynthesis